MNWLDFEGNIQNLASGTITLKLEDWDKITFISNHAILIVLPSGDQCS